MYTGVEDPERDGASGFDLLLLWVYTHSSSIAAKYEKQNALQSRVLAESINSE